MQEENWGDIEKVFQKKNRFIFNIVLIDNKLIKIKNLQTFKMILKYLKISVLCNKYLISEGM